MSNGLNDALEMDFMQSITLTITEMKEEMTDEMIVTECHLEMTGEAGVIADLQEMTDLLPEMTDLLPETHGETGRLPETGGLTTEILDWIKKNMVA